MLRRFWSFSGSHFWQLLRFTKHGCRRRIYFSPQAEDGVVVEDGVVDKGAMRGLKNGRAFKILHNIPPSLTHVGTRHQNQTTKNEKKNSEEKCCAQCKTSKLPRLFKGMFAPATSLLILSSSVQQLLLIETLQLPFPHVGLSSSADSLGSRLLRILSPSLAVTHSSNACPAEWRESGNRLRLSAADLLPADMEVSEICSDEEVDAAVDLQLRELQILEMPPSTRLAAPINCLHVTCHRLNRVRCESPAEVAVAAVNFEINF
jgi:hypothetical protein